MRLRSDWEFSIYFVVFYVLKKNCSQLFRANLKVPILVTDFYCKCTVILSTRYIVIQIQSSEAP